MLALRQHGLGVRGSFRPAWDGAKACGCGGAGMPCPSCNVSNEDNPPRLPGGFHETRVSTTTELLPLRTRRRCLILVRKLIDQVAVNAGWSGR